MPCVPGSNFVSLLLRSSRRILTVLRRASVYTRRDRAHRMHPPTPGSEGFLFSCVVFLAITIAIVYINDCRDVSTLLAGEEVREKKIITRDNFRSRTRGVTFVNL